jgi:hypothetical protein
MTPRAQPGTRVGRPGSGRVEMKLFPGAGRDLGVLVLNGGAELLKIKGNGGGHSKLPARTAGHAGMGPGSTHSSDL